MVVGLRYSLGILWLTLIVAETISSDTGIGYMAMNAREFMQRFTSLLVTHDVEEAVALANRLVLLQEGKVAFHMDIPLARPRRRNSTQFAKFAAQILERVMEA
jgi:ABC-type nitrate/sulfonate/bicarbonate transport system ATPase subunit